MKSLFMVIHETFSRVRSVRRTGRQGAICITQGNQTARSGISKTGRCEPAKTRAKAEDQAIRLGPRGSVALDGFRLPRFAFNLASKLSIGEALAHNLANEITESVCVGHRQPIVVSERLFVQVPEQVERFNRNIGSFQAALQETLEVLHGVGMNIPVYVFDRVVDDFVLELLGQAIVGRQFIGEDCRARFNVLLNVLLEFSLATVFNRHGANRSAALYHPEGDSLSGNAPRFFLCAALAILVHIARLAADESFIRLDFTTELSAPVLILHCKANPMEHEPCGLLSDTKRPVKLPGANPITVAANHPHRREPLVQAKRGILKDGANLDGELGQRMTGLALPDAPGSDEAYILAAATRANRLSIGPAMRREKGYTVVGVRKVLNRLDQRLWGGLISFHNSTLAGIA